MAGRVAAQYEQLTGRKKKVTGVQLGYESRVQPPHAFDVMLGSQLGLGCALPSTRGCRARWPHGERDRPARPTVLPFEKLIKPGTLTPAVRYVQHGSDFHQLARRLATKVESLE